MPEVVEPHQGTSYKPPVEAHQEVILKAYEDEEKRREAEKLGEVKKMERRMRLNLMRKGWLLRLTWLRRFLLRMMKRKQGRRRGW